MGGNYASSFGPGRYSVFGCVDFKGDGYEFPPGPGAQNDALGGGGGGNGRNVSGRGGPSEYGPYKINYPDLWGTDIDQHFYSSSLSPSLLLLSLSLTFPSL